MPLRHILFQGNKQLRKGTKVNSELRLSLLEAKRLLFPWEAHFRLFPSRGH